MANYTPVTTLNDIDDDLLSSPLGPNQSSSISSTSTNLNANYSGSVPPPRTIPIPASDYGVPAAFRVNNNRDDSDGDVERPSMLKNVLINVRFLCRAACEDFSRMYRANPKQVRAGVIHMERSDSRSNMTSIAQSQLVLRLKSLSLATSLLVTFCSASLEQVLSSP